MKLTLSKTLLSAAVMLGLTACSSGGGGGSNEPMTTQNKNQVAVPPSNTNTKPANNNQTTNNTNSSGNSSSNQKASNTNETINIPVIKNPTENTPKEMIWGVLPEMPKIETSTASGYGTELKGKATYFYKGDLKDIQLASSGFPGRTHSHGYILLNADFDNKKINGSSAFIVNSFFETEPNINRQVELTFEDTSLYKGNNRLVFDGKTTGRLISEDLKVENLSGGYSGDISSNSEKLYLNYGVRTADEKISLWIPHDGEILYKQ